MHQEDLSLRWMEIKKSWHNPMLILVLILMFVNWGIEALKWKQLLSKTQQISFVQSFKAILAGCTVSLITPNRIGEFGGRLIYVENQHKIKAIALSILGSITQLFVTFLLGLIGLIFLRSESIVNVANNTILQFLSIDLLMGLTVVATFALALLLFRSSLLMNFFSRFPLLLKRLKFLSSMERIAKKDMLRLFLLSLFRYMAFILQYLLMLRLMNVQIELSIGISLIAVFYLFMAIAPTIGFIELPIRATAGVVIFGLFSSNILGIQVAMFGIWLINLVIPALMGSVLMINKKIIKVV